ncbi:MAG: DUF2142 domain-containing protein [Patescibacteria group bacterium]
MHSQSKFSLGLALLLISVAIKGVLMAWLVPAWQQPDEPTHFQYTQLMVEEHRLPVSAGATQYFSPEVIRSTLSHGLANNLPVSVNRQLNTDGIPPESPDRKVFGSAPANTAAVYGPLNYLLLAVPYTLLQDAPVEQRLIAMRLVSVLLFLGVVLGAYGIAFALRPRQGFALAVAAAVGWHPMAAFIFAGVNNDALLTFLSTFAFWLLVHLHNRRIKFTHLIFIIILCIVGVLTKVPFIIFIPLFALMIFRKTNGFSMTVRIVVISALAILPVVSFILWQHSVTVSSLAGFVPPIKWTFPQRTVGNIANLTLLFRPSRVWISFWGLFGWMMYPLHVGVYAMTLLVGGATLSGIVLLLRDIHRKIASTITRENLLLLLTPFFLLEGLYLALFWKTIIIYNRPLFPLQGRYYFLLLAPIALLGLIGIERFVPQRLHKYGAWALAVFLLILNVDALVVMLQAWT